MTTIKPFAKRTDPFQESVIREMTRLGDEAGSVNLSQGLPDYDPPAEVLEAAAQAMRAGENQYTFPFGDLRLRQAVAEKLKSYNGIQADPETEITITCGVSEAITAAVLALTDPGDEAVILEPWYENYLPACLLAGVTPRFVPLRQPDDTFDPDELKAAFNPRTRLVLINTPHNPTGRVFEHSELETVASLCSQYGVIALTDEIYEHIIYAGRQHLSLGSLPGMEDRTVTASGLGKTYALTGWRVGWTAAAGPLSQRIRKVHDYLTICAPAPFQAAGVVALGLPESFYRELRSEYAHRREILLPALARAGFTFSPPQGAYYVMADFAGIAWPQDDYAQEGWSPDRAFAEYMALSVGVAVVPGSSFYAGQAAGRSRGRFNFAKRAATLLEAAARLETVGKPSSRLLRTKL